MQLIKKPTYIAPHGLASHGEYTPYYFLMDGKEHFIRNLIKSGGYTSYNSYNQRRKELAEVIKELRKNNFKFYVNHCVGGFKNPVEFIQWVKQNGNTFQIHGELLLKCDTFTDFHGNLSERSCAFSFRIYDKELLNQIKEELKKAKKILLYKRTKKN